MGQAELRSPSLLSPRSGPAVKGVANSNVKAEANSPARNERADRTEPSLPVTPERLELIKAYAKGRARLADEAATSRIAQRFAPRAPEASSSAEAKTHVPAPQTAPLTGLTAGIRRLTAVLVVAAILPNLTLALFWLGLIDPPWEEAAVSAPKEIALPAPEPASPLPKESSLPALRTAALAPVLTAPSLLDTLPGESVSFPIALDGTDGVPERSVIVIKGLPPGSTLSDGYAAGPAEWRLRPDAIGDLRLALAETAQGETMLLVELVAPDARVIAAASTMVRTQSGEPGPAPGPHDSVQIAEAVDAVDAGAPMSQGDAEEEFEVADAARMEAMPLPDRRPEPPGESNWIRPTAWVNLRESPSATASVVTIVPKGVKLRITGRKRAWVQVTNPATSESGWIYSTNVAAAR